MKGEALWARPCIRGRTGILELEPKVSECAARRAPTSAETKWARDLLATESAPPDTAAGLPRSPRIGGQTRTRREGSC
jgi:hypothetical protein